MLALHVTNILVESISRNADLKKAWKEHTKDREFHLSIDAELVSDDIEVGSSDSSGGDETCNGDTDKEGSEKTLDDDVPKISNNEVSEELENTMDDNEVDLRRGIF